MNSPCKTIGDYFTLQRGTTYKSGLLGQPGPLLLGLGTIQRNGGFRSDSLRTYGGDSPDHLLVQPGDLYVSLKDVTQSADLLGAADRFPPARHLGRLTQDTVRLIPKLHDVPSAYIYWLLRTPYSRAFCRAYATGTTNLGLAREDFLSLPVPEFNSSRQCVVDMLEALDDKVELNRRMNETLEAMARALFKSWFVDFDPVRARMEGRDTGLPQGIAELFPDRLADSEMGEIPEGWRACTLADVALLNPESWGHRNAPHSIRYVDLANTKSGYIDDIQEYTWAAAPSRARRVLRRGDTIVGTVRPGNRSFALIDRDGLTGSTGFAVLRPRNATEREIVWCAATSSDSIVRLAHLADGGAYPAVGPGAVLDTVVALPDDELRRTFSSLAAPMLNRPQGNRQESAMLAALRDTLLPKLVAGENLRHGRGATPANLAQGVVSERIGHATGPGEVAPTARSWSKRPRAERSR